MLVRILRSPFPSDLRFRLGVLGIPSGPRVTSHYLQVDFHFGFGRGSCLFVCLSFVPFRLCGFMPFRVHVGLSELCRGCDYLSSDSPHVDQ